MRQPVFVGDVQGCARELATLVERLDAELGRDAWELRLVGDLVNRGPGSLEVLRFVRARAEAGRARAVLGNHETALLRTALGLRRLQPTDTFRDVLEDEARDDWLAWLRRLPVALCEPVGPRPAVTVHAALRPEWELATVRARAAALEARLGAPDPREAAALLDALETPPRAPDVDDLACMLACRSVDAQGRWSAAPPEGDARPWHAAWRAFGHDYGVVYGHWALQGLHVEQGLRGLDTGCVHHGRDGDGFLTAWIPDCGRADPFDVPDAGFRRVRAFAPYYRAPARVHSPEHN